MQSPETVDQTVLSGTYISPEISKDEIVAAIARLKRNIALGLESIAAEQIFTTGHSGAEVTYKFCCKIYSDKIFPDVWKKAVMNPIHKKQGLLTPTAQRAVKHASFL